jgi:hypothetical protein
MWQGADGAPPALVQYLNGVLSQNPSSPSALPYADDVKWTARDHLLGLLNRCVHPLLILGKGCWPSDKHARGQPRIGCCLHDGAGPTKLATHFCPGRHGLRRESMSRAEVVGPLVRGGIVQRAKSARSTRCLQVQAT